MIARVEQWIRWPLWSWRNLAVTVVAVLVVFTAVGRLTNGQASASGRPSSGAEPVVPTGQVTAPTPSVAVPSPAMAPVPTTERPTGTGTSTGRPVATSTPSQVAVEFTRAWTRTTLDQATWLAGLKPFVTTEYLSSLSTVDPARVPASRVVDAGRELSTSGQQALVQVGTDGGAMTVTLVLRDGSWLVSDIEPTNQPPGAPTPSLAPSSATAR